MSQQDNVDKYESLIQLLRGINSNLVTHVNHLTQLEMQLNRLPFFMFYRSVLLTDSFARMGYKFINVIGLKKGQVYKHESKQSIQLDESVQSVLILLSGGINLLIGARRSKTFMKVYPGQDLFRNQLYEQDSKATHTVIASQDSTAMEIGFYNISELALYDFPFSSYRETYNYFSQQFPDALPLELVPIIRRIQLVKLSNNTMIYHAGDECRVVYFICDGEVELFQESMGKQQKMTICCRGDTFGEESLFSDKYVYTVRSHYFKTTILYQLQADPLLRECSPNIVQLLERKHRMRDSTILDKIRQSKSIHISAPPKKNAELAQNFYQYLHLISPRQQVNKIDRATSLNESGQFNFMVMNNPGRNHSRLFDKHVHNMMLKNLSDPQPEHRRFQKFELQKLRNHTTKQGKVISSVNQLNKF